MNKTLPDVIQYLEHKKDYADKHKLSHESKQLTAMIDCCEEVLTLLESKPLK